MIKFIKTDFSFDEEKIFRQLHLKENRSATKHTRMVLPMLTKLLKENMELTTCYSLQDNDFQAPLPGIGCCSQVALCYCSCTRRINDVIDTMLSQGEILDGFLLNHMANAVFFEASNQMNGKLAHVLSERGLHLTKRYAAGEGEVPLSVQAIILDALKTETELEVNLTSNYMLEPEHSMLYYFGADAGITGHSTRHDCGACNSEDCPFRDVEGDVAEGLIKNAKPQTSWSALRAFDRLYRGFSSHRVIPFFRGAVNAWTWPAGGGTIPFGGKR
ncbi:hypothetical protein SAMN04515656_10572 [Eubacterium aggregans]|uniref:Vitamin B12 dependent methionine synthase, activation domain n=2 Tax=Eubacterium aggregans TaxID=81409 RepID=A0A1H3Z9A8_9FIRM|nr:hypothetical protein SAMN04515656_10572 [Eubacterium aggregans]